MDTLPESRTPLSLERPFLIDVRGFLFLLGCMLCCSFLPAQNSSATSTPATSPAQSENARPENPQTTAEITAHDEPATFKVNVKLVVVRAVVRDAQGHAIGNLNKEDFQIFDKGKPQTISQFEVERPGDLAAKARQTAEENSDESAPGEAGASAKAAPNAPERFIAYVFDDVHLQFGDLAQVREAAERHFATLRPTDRAAIFTTSGEHNLDFTDDRTKLHDALFRLMPRPIARVITDNACPDISYYQADQITNKQDPDATTVATEETIACLVNLQNQIPTIAARMAPMVVNTTSQQVLDAGDHESRITLGVLRDVVESISHVPGQRSVVLVSPGFIAPQLEYDYLDIIDRAVRGRVVINTLNAKGLYTIDPLGDISHTPLVTPPPQKSLIVAAAATANDDLLATFADATGGVFFHNNNDFEEGFRRVAQTPEYSYVLAFAPQGLKLDGSYHELKITLKDQPKLTVQARRGYFAPKHFTDPAEQAKQEIEEAMYSQDELHNLPVKLHTQFFKSGDDEAKLIVLAHIDVQRMRYRKADGRNNDVLTCVSAVFNRNGRFLQGTQKTVTMHWRDETLANKLASGITLKNSFDVKPGSYLVRLVVRDSEGQLMSAENGTVEIR
jgi:VWFA-related protein